MSKFVSTSTTKKLRKAMLPSSTFSTDIICEVRVHAHFSDNSARVYY